MKKLSGITLISLLVLCLGIAQAQAGKLPSGYPESFHEHGQIDALYNLGNGTYKIVVGDLGHIMPHKALVKMSATRTGSVGQLRPGLYVGLILDDNSGDVTEVWQIPRNYTP